jgi:glycosyltransferase involved in cell wall biosynthesis
MAADVGMIPMAPPSGSRAPLRILIATGIFPPDVGGPATHVPLIARGLAERGHVVTVVTLGDRRPATEPRTYEVVAVSRRQPRWRRCLEVIRTLSRLAREADVLLAVTLEVEAALASRACRRPLVHRVVGDRIWEQAVLAGRTTASFEAFQQARLGPRLAGLRALRDWSIRQGDRVIVPSRFLGRWVGQWGVTADRITVVRNAVEPLDGIRPEPAPLATPHRLATHARLVPWKRIDRLIDVLRSVEGTGLLVVGDGPESARLAAHARTLGVSGRVRFTGDQPRAMALALVAACDLFVLSSTYEGSPHSVLEAMGLGVPVVVTAAGGVPEVVTDGVNGRVVDCADPDALRGAVEALLATPACRERLAAGARATATQFGVAAMVTETEAALAQAARGGARRPAAGRAQ